MEEQTYKIYLSEEGGFQLPLPIGWTVTSSADSDRFYAVRLVGDEDDCQAVVQRFRTNLRVIERSEFDAVLEGVLLGIEESVGPLKILEQKVTLVGSEGLAADFVLRGQDAGSEVMQRRRLITHGPVPPRGLYLITCTCKADRFLVHRQTFEAMIEGFGEVSGES